MYTGGPSVEATTDNDSPASCFAADSVVTMVSGESKSISEVVVGDSILAATSDLGLYWSRVIAIPHLKNLIPAEFIQINLLSGKSVKMTYEHLLPSGSCGQRVVFTLKAAFLLKIGECVLTDSGNDAIQSIEIVKGRGLYSLVTEMPFVVINGVVASPFAVSHDAANLYYDIYRLFYYLFPTFMASSTFMKMHDKVSFYAFSL